MGQALVPGHGELALDVADLADGKREVAMARLMVNGLEAAKAISCPSSASGHSAHFPEV